MRYTLEQWKAQETVLRWVCLFERGASPKVVDVLRVASCKNNAVCLTSPSSISEPLPDCEWLLERNVFVSTLPRSVIVFTARAAHMCTHKVVPHITNIVMLVHQPSSGSRPHYALPRSYWNLKHSFRPQTPPQGHPGFYNPRVGQSRKFEGGVSTLARPMAA